MAIYRGPGGTGDSSRGESVEGPNSTIENLTGLIGPIRTPTYIEFDKTANHTPIAGQLAWNEQEGTLDVGLNTGAVTLQIGEEILYRVHNGSGLVIPDGTLVMATGTLGNSGRIVVAAYDGLASPETIMGLATEEIGIGLEGYVTHFGKVRGIQTNGGNYGESWVDGDVIYAAPTGGLTNTRPEAPNTKTIIAIVINAHGSNGTLFVRVTPSSSLSNDDLVEIGTLTNGDILVYNSTTSRFENVANTALQPGDNVSDLVNDAGYLTTETDPVYTGSSWYATTNNSTNWDTAYSWGDHATEGYLDAGDVGTTVLAYDSNLQSFVNTFTLPTADGTANQVVATDGAGNLVFNTISGTGTVTSVDITAGTGISTTGGPITTNGSITVTNTAPMTYPSVGLAVSTGSAWGTSKTTPTGDVVGTTDTQTLTNKTISMSGLHQLDQSTNIVAAATTDLGTATGNAVTVTHASGTLAITSFGGASLQSGTELTITWAVSGGSLSVTHNATSSILPSGADLPIANGDVWKVQKISDSQPYWRAIDITKADGTPVVGNATQIQPITASVGSNALTITLNPTTLDFRDATLGSGTINTRTVSSAISVVVSSGSTLGTINAVQNRLAVLAIDNAGTVELAVVNLAGGTNLDETGVISTTAEGGAGAADSATVIYSTTARTNVPYRVVGFVESTQATAGTWATAPSKIQGYGGQAFAAMSSLGYGQTWQNVLASRASGTTYYNTTGKPILVAVGSPTTGGAVSGRALTAKVFGVTVASAGSNATYSYPCVEFLVPPGGDYVVTAGGGIAFWSELR